MNNPVQGAIDNALNSQNIPQIQLTIRATNGYGQVRVRTPIPEAFNRTAIEMSSRNDVSGCLNLESIPRDTHCSVDDARALLNSVKIPIFQIELGH